jgi:hypothetical protein
MNLNPKEHGWVHLLCDSHRTAVYAVMIEKCLESSDALVGIATCAHTQDFTALETNINIQHGEKLPGSI